MAKVSKKTVTTEKKTDRRKTMPHLFKPGQSGNPAGRAKGSRNKLAAAFIDDFYKDWQEKGSEAIAEVRENDPAAYLRVGASLIPKEFTLNENSDTAIDAMLDKLNDEQLDELVAGLVALGRQENRTGDNARKDKAKNTPQSNSVH